MTSESNLGIEQVDTSAFQSRRQLLAKSFYLLTSIVSLSSMIVGCGGGASSKSSNTEENVSGGVSFAISDSLKKVARSVFHPSGSTLISNTTLLTVKGSPNSIQSYTITDQNNNCVAFASNFGVTANCEFNSKNTLLSLLTIASLSNPKSLSDFNSLVEKITLLEGFNDVENLIASKSGESLKNIFSDSTLQLKFSALVQTLLNANPSRAVIPEAAYIFARQDDKVSFEGQGYRCCNIVQRTKYGESYFYDVVSRGNCGPIYDLLTWSLLGGSLQPGEKWSGTIPSNTALSSLDYFIQGPSFSLGNNELPSVFNKNVINDSRILWVQTAWRYIIVPLYNLVMGGEILGKDDLESIPNLKEYIEKTIKVAFGVDDVIAITPIGFVKNMFEWSLELASSTRFWEIIGINASKTFALPGLISILSGLLEILAVSNSIPNLVRCFETLNSTESVVKIPIALGATSNDYSTGSDGIRLFLNWDFGSESDDNSANLVEIPSILTMNGQIRQVNVAGYAGDNLGSLDIDWLQLSPNQTYNITLQAKSGSNPLLTWDISIPKDTRISVKLIKPLFLGGIGDATIEIEQDFRTYPNRSSGDDGISVGPIGQPVVRAGGITQDGQGRYDELITGEYSAATALREFPTPIHVGFPRVVGDALGIVDLKSGATISIGATVELPAKSSGDSNYKIYPSFGIEFKDWPASLAGLQDGSDEKIIDHGASYTKDRYDISIRQL